MKDWAFYRRYGRFSVYVSLTRVWARWRDAQNMPRLFLWLGAAPTGGSA